MRELYGLLGRFNDLIFCPLDLPAPPAVARELVLEWVNKIRARGTTAEEGLTAQNSVSYPWNSAYAARAGEWRDGFDAAFPEIVSYLRLFPTRSWKSWPWTYRLPVAALTKKRSPARPCEATPAWP